MLGQTRNKKNKEIISAMCIIMAVAVVFSFASTIFAANSNDEVASFRTMSTAVIKGSENVPEISVSAFLKNIWKNTGINQLINGEIPAAEHVASEDPFAGIVAPGWQKLLMMAIGFLKWQDACSTVPVQDAACLH